MTSWNEGRGPHHGKSTFLNPYTTLEAQLRVARKSIYRKPFLRAKKLCPERVSAPEPP